MNKIEVLISNYFRNVNIKVNMEDVFKVISKYNLTEKELDIILFDIKNNLPFFEKELSSNGLVISNLLTYAFDAIYVPKNKWSGSSNRNRITKEYQSILNEKNSIEDLTKKDILEISNEVYEQKIFKNFKKEILWVDNEHRTHPWSVRPGGGSVVVVYLTGKVLGYDKVKRPHRYIPKIFRGDKESIHTKWDDKTLYKYLLDYIESIGAAKPESDELNILYTNGDEVDIIELLKDYQTE